MMTWMRPLAACLLLAACGSDPTELVAVVATDMDIPHELIGYRLQVTNEDGRERFEGDGMRVPLTSNGNLPDTHVVEPSGDDPAREEVTISATAVGADGRDMYTTSTHTSFLEEHRLRVDLFLTRACRPVTCPANLTCRAGACLDPAIDPHDLPAWDPHQPIPSGPTDAGAVDGGAGDAGADAGSDSGIDAGPDLDAGLDAAPDASAGCDPLGDDCDATEACHVGDDGAAACGADGPGAPGDACDEDDDCAAGTDCAHDPGDPGVCRPYCRPGVDCAGGEQCLAIVVGALGRCSMDCRLGVDCPAGLECAIATSSAFDGTPTEARGCRSFGAALEDEPCGDDERCAAGLTCYRRATGQSQGLCRPSCNDRGTTCADPDATCVAILENGAALSDGACSSPCDPEAGAACGPLTCTIELVDDVFGGAGRTAICAPAGDGASCEPCVTSADCDAGLACDGGACTDVCVVGDDATCAAGGACTSRGEDIVVDGTEYSFCGAC